MSRELAALRQFMPESDPERTWRNAYAAARDRYFLLGFIAYPLSIAICFGGIVLFGWLVASLLRPEHLKIRYVAFAATYDAIAFRVLIGLTPWLPWPPWFREYGELHDTLKPFDRVMRRLRGEPDPDVA